MESWNGKLKLKWKAEAESWNGKLKRKAEIIGNTNLRMRICRPISCLVLRDGRREVSVLAVSFAIVTLVATVRISIPFAL